MPPRKKKVTFRRMNPSESSSSVAVGMFAYGTDEPSNARGFVCTTMSAVTEAVLLVIEFSLLMLGITEVERKVDNETLLLVTPDALLEELALLSSACIEIAPTVFVEVIAVKNLLRCFCHFFAFSFADEVTVVRKGGRGSLRQRVSNA